MTGLVLLRPHVLAFKNKLLNRGSSRHLLRSVMGAVFLVCLVSLIYSVHLSFLKNLSRGADYSPELVTSLLSFFFFGFFILMLLSGTIVALSSLYFAEDVPLVLGAPVSLLQFYFAKLVEVALSGSWIFLLFAIPALVAHYDGLNLPWHFLLTSVGVLVPFLLIPTAVAIMAVTLFVNVIPPHRMRDLLIAVSFMVSCAILFAGKGSPEYFATSTEENQELLRFLAEYRDPQPWWLPSRWATDIICSYITKDGTPRALLFFVLYSTALGINALGYLVVERYFRRGLAVAGKAAKMPQIRSSRFGAFFARCLIPWSSQFRAMFFKELKMFIRDTTQALQLLMLLLLTFMYLYNFRSLRTTSQFSPEGMIWWQVVLALANTAFGACVLAAVATRFVFPCVSLEGRAYYLLRATPLSLTRYLWYKFLIWFIPGAILALVLLISGTMAIQGTLQTISTTAAIAVSIAFGVIGLAVGIGAVYARFDWDSPAQVTASFGSLVYMFLSLLLILVSIIPASFLFILSCNPEFANQMRPFDYWASYSGSLMLLISLNVMVTKRAIAAGVNVLNEVS